MQTIWPPSRDSIFGDTYAGVPNPNVPHVHPYPTRFHGPNYTVPGSAHDSYVERTYALPSYLGTDGLGRAPIFENVSGNAFVDGALGAALGYFGSPSRDKESRVMWAIGAGIAAYAAGLAGMIGAGGALFYTHQKKG